MIEALQHTGNSSTAMLFAWLLFVSASGYAYFRKPKWTVYFLFAAAVCIAAAFALFTPYLFAWDEQFHALVAKNLAQNPLVPKLYTHHPFEIEQNWLNTEIWLHKQPLFTWQIALSLKLLGNTAFAVRFPSVLFHGFLTIAVFRIGQLVFNRKTGFAAALIIMHSSFLLGLISGRIGTDHNDFIFLCYITFSFWAWFEWQHSSMRKWLIWIGVFAGCAILTKWLVGLLVFAGWGIVVLSTIRQKGSWLSVKPVLTAFATTLVTFLPWQIYTFIRFPAEASREMSYNSDHVFKAVENHIGDAWFHFDKLRELYFNPVDFLLLFGAGLIFLLLSKTKKEHKIFLLVSIGVIYLFFTIVQTKMPAFTAPVYAFTILIIAHGIVSFTAWIRNPKISKTICILLTLLTVNWILKPSATLSAYGFHKDEYTEAGHRHMLQAYQIMRSEGKNDPKRIVFGVELFPFSNISWMFFNGELAYPFVPTDEQVKEVEKQGYEVYVLKRKIKN